MRTLIIAVAALSMAAPVVAQSQDVSIKGSDGFQLQGTFSDARKSGPGLLLLPACDGDRTMFDNLRELLTNAGYSVLTLDYRGMGGSKAGAFNDFRKQRTEIMKHMSTDIDAALAFLAVQKNVNGSRMGIIGIECGVAQAAAAAQRNSSVKAVVLLAGLPGAANVEYIKLKKMPVFAAAAAKDAPGTAALKGVVAASGNVDSEFAALNGGGQGATLFTKEPDLEVDVVLWHRRAFPVASYAPLK